ncbi:hypothetical protein [Stratiformator vulcanicus]|uniref:Phage major tail protein 2 n=1 Tax=Stratiformator vulcanicus TaxID=2527980 RepID=A0A517R757_9PLAN|nr:hypothetical protein [Stratiformator vulcanicus]QDT39726.1 hypothetical protein Pan189_41350 [Stratiformator vulcanicus]
MAGGYKTGRRCKTYYDAAGAGQGTWTATEITKNPQLDLSADEAVVEDESSIWKRYMQGLLDAPLTLNINRKVNHAFYNALRASALAGTPIGIALASGAITTVDEEVFTGDFVVFGFPFGGAQGETQEMSVTLKLAADSSFAPSFATVTA